MSTTSRKRTKKEREIEYPIVITTCVLCGEQAVCFQKPDGTQCVSDWDCNRRCLHQAQTQLGALHVALDQADEDAAQLRQALRHYGRHLDGCALPETGVCSCGLVEAYAEPLLVLTTLDSEEGGEDR